MSALLLSTAHEAPSGRIRSSERRSTSAAAATLGAAASAAHFRLLRARLMEGPANSGFSGLLPSLCAADPAAGFTLHPCDDRFNFSLRFTEPDDWTSEKEVVRFMSVLLRACSGGPGRWGGGEGDGQ